jgi:hypothetical protein
LLFFYGTLWIHSVEGVPSRPIDSVDTTLWTRLALHNTLATSRLRSGRLGSITRPLSSTISLDSGGYHKANRNDVWHSTDGVHWYEVPKTPWARRHAASVLAHEVALMDGGWQQHGKRCVETHAQE